MFLKRKQDLKPMKLVFKYEPSIFETKGEAVKGTRDF